MWQEEKGKIHKKLVFCFCVNACMFKILVYEAIIFMNPTFLSLIKRTNNNFVTFKAHHELDKCHEQGFSFIFHLIFAGYESRHGILSNFL